MAGYFRLIMPRKVLIAVNTLCDEYEDKFKEKVATAKVTNALLTRQCISLGLIPKNTMTKIYGCEDPINTGFTAKARNEKSGMAKLLEQAQKEKMEVHFSRVLAQWAEHPDPEWRRKKIAHAKMWPELKSAQLIVALENGDFKP